MLNLSLLPLVLIGVLIGCGGDNNPESTPKDGNGTGIPEAQGSDNKEATLAEYLPGKRFLLEMNEQMKRESQNITCGNNLRNLELAVLHWTLKNRKADTSEVTLEELAPFFKDGIPKCPAGGNYILTTVNEKPKCSYGHALDFKKGDKMPPYNGPEIRVFIQFNENGTAQFGEINEKGQAGRPSQPMTYEVSGPMELTLKQGETHGGRLVFTKTNPARGDRFTMLEGVEGSEGVTMPPIAEVVPAIPLKEPKIPEGREVGELEEPFEPVE